MVANAPPLSPHERILWNGQPATGFLWRPIEWILVPFSLFWAGFAVFWNVSVWDANAPIDFRLFGIPFLIAGLYVTVGRFVIDSWVRGRTRYFVTDQRVIVARRSIKSLNLKRLPVLELDEKSDGSGTIRFESDPSLFVRGNGFGVWSPAIGGPMQFMGIDNVRAVYDLIVRQTD